MKNGVLANSCFHTQNFWMAIRKHRRKGAPITEERKCWNQRKEEKKRVQVFLKFDTNKMKFTPPPPRKSYDVDDENIENFFLYTHRNDGLSKVKSRSETFVFFFSFSIKESTTGHGSLHEMGNAVWFHGYMDVTTPDGQPIWLFLPIEKLVSRFPPKHFLNKTKSWNEKTKKKKKTKKTQEFLT